jgi:aminopeptidase N
MWDTLGTHKASVVLEHIFPRPLASPELLERVDAWLATAPAKAGAKRYVAEGRSDAARALAAQERDARA